MTKALSSFMAALLLAATSATALAQDYDYHPALSDNFTASIGWMRSSNSFKAEAEGLDREEDGDYIDFEDALGVSGHSTLWNAQLRWKFGRERKWSLFGQYFSNSAKGEAVLEEDVSWDGVIFREGSQVGAGVKMGVARLMVGRSWIKNDQHDFGVAVGIHNIDIDLYIEGDVAIDDGGFEYERHEVGGSQVLPNIGAWYNFSPAKRWLLHARVDWISADIGDYDGTLWNTTVGVNFQAWRHVGFDLYWQYFNLNGGAEKDDWRGRLDLTYSGPVVAMTFAW